MSRLGHALIAPLLLALSLGVLASGVDTYQFRHPERQNRAQELARALRCPQCQNQNLVESNSPIARDLRLEVYRWVDEGQSDEQVIARMTERFGDFVRYDPPFKRSTALLWGGPALLLLLALNRLRRSLHRRQPARVPLIGDRAEGALAHDPRAELNRLIMAEQQAGLAPHSRLYRELELARLANATPPAEQALRDRLAREPSARPLRWLLLWILIGVLVLVAGIYAGTGRYQAWQAYQSRPDPLAGLSPQDLQDKALGALHQRLQANPADLEAWAELGQLYLYRDEYANALLAYQRLALQEGGASAATQAAQATVLYYQAGQQLTPEAQRLLGSALKQDKGEVSALMLLASDHFLHGRYSQAIALWQQLLDSERPRINRAALIEAIQTARMMGG
ncbi:heme lyase NrfEFG subunit NrfF [Aeromonas media]|uniref:Formate-dependent nitrite reductase complex subunit n=3 Tax=Aeromonas media TaxID=651 RepID=A0AAE7AH54_AERME|nr:heme lyase NrfEFG subunit NrfF [Aeromonas media]MBS4641022.1 heme lyase NrfEFG subunit NrfF [Aeromonas media]MCV3290138.1 heme lyase NrfEFG subunit NrfF [Aeromonas media]QJT30477.1 heme lyase NrfEFG subunit NrfF [Aeromonas media]QJT34957.1 heme lyase NrfEFG subunit NrfF [Aeromonas media]QJT40540.1 heme lyase NrfEFG subunit NrfF [Aeromonas media]